MSDAMRLPEPPGTPRGHQTDGRAHANGHRADGPAQTGWSLSAEQHEELRIAVGALALDALDADEARRVREHMAGCPDCETEYQSFLGVRGIMDGVLVGGIPRAERYQAHVVERRPRNTGVAAVPRSRRRRAVVALSGMAAAFLLVVGGAAGALIGSHHSGPAQVAEGGQSALGGGQLEHLTPVSNTFGVTAALSYQEVNWGTWVQVTMSNVPADYSCKLMAYDKQGHEYPVSSWRSAEGQTSVTAPGAVSLSPDEIDHFEVDMGPQGSGPLPWSLAIPMTS